MRVEINDWSATFDCDPVSDPVSDLWLLARVYEKAREEQMPCASINVHYVLVPRAGDKFVQKPYVWIPHFDEKDVSELLVRAGIPIESVEVVRVPFSGPEYKKIKRICG